MLPKERIKCLRNSTKGCQTRNRLDSQRRRKKKHTRNFLEPSLITLQRLCIFETNEKLALPFYLALCGLSRIRKSRRLNWNEERRNNYKPISFGIKETDENFETKPISSTVSGHKNKQLDLKLLEKGRRPANLYCLRHRQPQTKANDERRARFCFKYYKNYQKRNLHLILSNLKKQS